MAYIKVKDIFWFPNLKFYGDFMNTEFEILETFKTEQADSFSKHVFVLLFYYRSLKIIEIVVL